MHVPQALAGVFLAPSLIEEIDQLEVIRYLTCEYAVLNTNPSLLRNLTPIF